jgi:hypothetical protein
VPPAWGGFVVGGGLGVLWGGSVGFSDMMDELSKEVENGKKMGKS